MKEKNLSYQNPLERMVFSLQKNLRESISGIKERKSLIAHLFAGLNLPGIPHHLEMDKNLISGETLKKIKQSLKASKKERLLRKDGV